MGLKEYCLFFLSLEQILILTRFVLASEVIVETNYGALRGEFISSSTGFNVSQFLGVPYAAPPIGHLRFKPPENATRWPNIRDAQEFSASCPQWMNAWKPTKRRYKLVGAPKGYLGFHRARILHRRTSEDCLYMNIYVPGEVDPGREQPLPVMVYIHGGGYEVGFGMNYPGYRLAEEGVILVNFNYRLGALGFFSTGDENAPGNYGLMDQILALKWVKDNIGHFGGDPKRVTIFGQSSGGASVGFHLLSPYSEGFFSKAITQSGVPNAHGFYSTENSTTMAAAWAKQWGCGKAKTNAILVACLRSLPVETFVDPNLTRAFLPRIDGDYIPAHPNTLLEEGRINRADILLGSNHDEGSIILPQKPLNFWFHVSKRAFEAAINETFSKADDMRVFGAMRGPSVFAPLVIFEYMPADPNPLSYRRAYLDFLRDGLAASVDFAAKNHARTQAGRVFKYFFNHRPLTSIHPKFLRASHSEELLFVFGDIQETKDFNLHATAEERALSKTMIKLWTNFAKTGNPNPLDPKRPAVVWPEYTAANGEYLEITTEFSPRSAKKHLLERKVRFWNDIMVPLMATADKEAQKKAESEALIAQLIEKDSDPYIGRIGMRASQVQITITMLGVLCFALLLVVVGTVIGLVHFIRRQEDKKGSILDLLPAGCVRALRRLQNGAWRKDRLTNQSAPKAGLRHAQKVFYTKGGPTPTPKPRTKTTAVVEQSD